MNIKLNRINNIVEVYQNSVYIGYCEKYGYTWGCSNTEQSVYAGANTLREAFEVLLEEVTA